MEVVSLSAAQGYDRVSVQTMQIVVPRVTREHQNRSSAALMDDHIAPDDFLTSVAQLWVT